MTIVITHAPIIALIVINNTLKAISFLNETRTFALQTESLFISSTTTMKR